MCACVCVVCHISKSTPAVGARVSSSGSPAFTAASAASTFFSTSSVTASVSAFKAFTASALSKSFTTSAAASLCVYGRVCCVCLCVACKSKSEMATHAYCMGIKGSRSRHTCTHTFTHILMHTHTQHTNKHTRTPASALQAHASSTLAAKTLAGSAEGFCRDGVGSESGQGVPERRRVRECDYEWAFEWACDHGEALKMACRQAAPQNCTVFLVVGICVPTVLLRRCALLLTSRQKARAASGRQ